MLETCFAGLNVKVWSLASENTHLTQALEFCHDFPAKFQTNCTHSTLDRKQVTCRTHRTDMCWPVDPFSVITSLNRISRWTLPCWPWGEETLHITKAMSLQSLVKAQVKSYVGRKQDKNLACSTDDMRYFCTPCLFVTKLHISLAVIFQNGFCLFSKTCSPAPPHTPSWFRLMGEPGEWQEPQQLWILKM